MKKAFGILAVGLSVLGIGGYLQAQTMTWGTCGPYSYQCPTLNCCNVAPPPPAPLPTCTNPGSTISYSFNRVSQTGQVLGGTCGGTGSACPAYSSTCTTNKYFGTNSTDPDCPNNS